MGVVETAARQWFRAACPGALQRLGRHNWEIRVLLFLYGFGFEHWVKPYKRVVTVCVCKGLKRSVCVWLLPPRPPPRRQPQPTLLHTLLHSARIINYIRTLRGTD